MQLTNYSAIDLRHGAAKVLDARDHSIRRITTGERMARASDDPGGLAVAMKQDVVNHQRSVLRTNLQNARTYVEAQGKGLLKVNAIYERMSLLATQALDVALNDGDRADLDVEFQELIAGLDKLLNDKFNGVKLFNQNVKCGGVQDIPLNALDYRTSDPGPDGLTKNGDPTATPPIPPDPDFALDDVTQAIRGQTLDVHATGGTLSFSVNSGGAGEIYRVFMGGQELFSTGPSFTAGGDHTDPIVYGYKPAYTGLKPQNDTTGILQSSNWGNDSWRTSGSANSGDNDTFKVKFGPGKPTTYEIDYGVSNSTDPFGVPSGPTTENPAKYFDYESFGQGDLESAGGNGVIRTSDLLPGSKTTELTLHFETKSIGIISNVTFEPESEDTQLTIGENGETMSLTAKGFSSMSGYDITTAANAQKTLNKLLGDADHVGEADCVLYERLGAVRAEAARLDERLHELGDQLVQGEAAYGRIADLDYAKEMTRFATNSMQLNVMTSTMGSANRATNLLMPLTTQQFQSAVTQRFQLL